MVLRWLLWALLCNVKQGNIDSFSEPPDLLSLLHGFSSAIELFTPVKARGIVVDNRLRCTLMRNLSFRISNAENLRHSFGINRKNFEYRKTGQY